MVRVTVPTDFPVWLAFRQVTFSTGAPEPIRWQSPYVAQFDALPLYLGFTETLGIRADGELIRWSTEGEYAGMRPVEDQALSIFALVEGSHWYPELQALLPPRPAGAVDCPHLEHRFIVEHRLFCSDCCGLGWVAAGDADRWLATVLERCEDRDATRAEDSPR